MCHGWVCPKTNTKSLYFLIKRPWKGAYLVLCQFPRRRLCIMVSLEYLPYYCKLFNHIWQLYTLGMGKFFHMLKFDLWSLSRSHDQKIVFSGTPTCHRSSGKSTDSRLVTSYTCLYYQKRELIRFWKQSDENWPIYEWFSHRYQSESLKFMWTPLLLYPQTKVGDILDSGPSRRRRRRRRNILVDAITQKQINIFFSNLVHMLRVPKGRSLF